MKGRRGRELVFRGLLVTLGGLLAVGGRARGEVADIFRGPYLQQAAPESIVVVWRTDGPTQPAVRLGDSPQTLNRQVDGEAITLRVSVDVEMPGDVPRLYQEPGEDAKKRDPRDDDPSTAPGTYQYEAEVVGLEPGRHYYYGVYDGDRLLAGGDANHYLVTSPPRGSDANLRIWVVGDSGTGERDQKQVHLAQEYTDQTNRDLDLYLHVGDMAYGDGTDRQFQHNFFEVYQSTLRNTVCWPTMGNHEGHTSRGISGFGPYYDAYVVPTAAEAGGLPSGTEAYYSFDIADVHFVCLDSHDLDRTPGGAMAQWLQADLEEAQGDWLIAFWHHPPYTKGSHDSDREGQLIEMRTHIMPILEAGGVDIVLAGHSHIYERSMLFDGAYQTPTTSAGVILDDGDGSPEGDGAYRKSKGLNPHEGTVAIVAGHGGAGLSRRGTMPVMREIIVEHGSVILDVVGDTLTGTMVNKDTARRDLFQIVKQGQVEVARIADPWQPLHDFSQITHFLVTFHEETPGKPPSKWSVVRGEAKGVTVEAQPNSTAKQLAVDAAGEAVVAVYQPYEEELGEYETRMSIPADATGPAGLVFAWKDRENYFALRLDPRSQEGEVVRCTDGVETVLTRRSIDIDLSQPIKIEIEPTGRLIEVQLQDAIEYTVKLKQPLPAGRVGVYVGAHGSARFPGFGVRRASP